MTLYTLRGTVTDLAGGQAAQDVQVDVVGAPQYATPDLLSNLSFETGWDGFTSNRIELEPGPTWWERVTEQAFMGQYSARASWYFGQPGNDAESRWRHCQHTFPGVSELFIRTYMRFSTQIQLGGGAMKFFPVAVGGTRQGGLYWDNGGVFTYFDGTDGQDHVWTPSEAAGGLAPLWEANRWFCVEYQWQQAPTKRMRLWIDGQPVFRAPDTMIGSCQWQADGWLNSNSPGGSLLVDTFWFASQISMESQQNSGFIYFDRVAVSTQRIGP